MDQFRVAITAGASGIGRALAQAFLRDHAVVYICDADETALADFCVANPAAVATRADVSVPGDVDRWFERIAADGPVLDVLINNAGIAGPTARLEEIATEDWMRTIDVDLNGVFFCTRRAIPMIRLSANGSIVNIASNAAFSGFPLRSPYTACKWAMIGLTKTLAMELGPAGVRVNAICPGSVEGPRIRRVIEMDAACRGMTADAVAQEYMRQSSLRTFVDNDDIAAMVQFLTSPSGRRISGQAIGVDGHTEGLWLDMGD